MIKPASSRNHCCTEYETLLIELHRLIAAGEGDSPDADRLRERMELLAEELSSVELKRLKGLSADLYMLQDDEVYELEDADGWTKQRIAEELQAAAGSGDRDRILAGLRKGPLLPPAQTAFLRARSYESLGHLDSALAFMEYAAKRDPQNPSYKIFVMQLQYLLGRRDEAFERAKSYINQKDIDVTLLIFSASYLYGSTRDLGRNEALSVCGRLVEVLEPRLKVIPPLKTTPRAMIVLGYLVLGSCYEELGREPDADLAYDSALELNPEDDLVFTMKGILRLDSSPEEARTYFEKAVQRHTTARTPYLFLAQYDLQHGSYQGCLDMCNRLMKISAEPSILAEAWHWTAIAAHQLGSPMHEVQTAFERAISLDPLNEQIRNNLDLFRVLQTQQAIGDPIPAAWQASRGFNRQRERVELLAGATP